MDSIRAVEKGDITALKKVLDSIELFPSEMLDDMIADYFNNPHSEDIWFTAIEKAEAISIAYCAPEKLTNGTYNLYAIGVRSDLQDKGIGGKMMDYLENLLREKGHRILIVETSGTPDLELTREFYRKKGYTQEASIREFWDEGDDKIIFWKSLKESKKS
ncbi:MAG: GNAT family N-acetyltransferase [Bacteroidota bacterium]